MRMLLVDDHELVRRGLRSLLQDAWPGVSIGEAQDCQSARGLVAGDPWDIVVLDISLPDMDGLDFITELKQSPSVRSVLVLSMHTEQDFAVRAFRLGADGYLSKSSIADEVEPAIRKILAGGKYVAGNLAEPLASALAAPTTPLPHESLSARELEVLRFVATGRTIKQIATDLGLSEKTVGTYRSRVSEKLKLSTNVELARYALKHRLVE